MTNSNRPYAKIQNNEALTGDMEFAVLYTVCALSNNNTGNGTATAADNLLRIQEILSLRSQPVIVSVSSITGVDLQVAANRTAYGLTGATWNGVAYASVTVYRLAFSFEKAGNLGVGLTQDGTVANTVAKLLADETALAALPFVTAVGTGPVNLSALTFSGAQNTAGVFVSTSLQSA